MMPLVDVLVYDFRGLSLLENDCSGDSLFAL